MIAGYLEIGESILNTTYIFTRNSYSKPALYIPHDKPSVACSFCPFKFKLNPNVESRYLLSPDHNKEAEAISEEKSDQQQQKPPENLFK